MSGVEGMLYLKVVTVWCAGVATAVQMGEINTHKDAIDRGPQLVQYKPVIGLIGVDLAELYITRYILQSIYDNEYQG